MTVPDLGPERPGDATETRQMGERGRTHALETFSERAVARRYAALYERAVASR